MIQYKKGDILKENADALINTVNCVGVMGRGIALQFKKSFPENFHAYEKACKQKNVLPGHMFVYETKQLTNPRYIINFPTKRHWKGKSSLIDVEKGLNDLADKIKELNIRSIAIPPLGAGLGGLDWQEVRSMIEKKLGSLDSVEIMVFEPNGAPDAKTMSRLREVPKMTEGRAVLVKLMHRHLRGLMDPFITLLEVHKLMFFMQEAGQKLKLQYEKETSGPYAKNLGHVLNRIEGHMISGYADGEDAPTKELEIMPGAMEDTEAFLKNYPETQERIERVTDLIDGFETAFGLELLSTVYWLCEKQEIKNMDEIIKNTHAWAPHKIKFTGEQIKIAHQTLLDKNWIQ